MISMPLADNWSAKCWIGRGAAAITRQNSRPAPMLHDSRPRHRRYWPIASMVLALLLTMVAALPTAQADRESREARQARKAEAAHLRATGKTLKDAADLNVSLGQAYMARGQLDLAMEKLQKALAFYPKSSDANTVIAVLYEQIGNAPKALEHYTRAQKLAPESGNANNNLGRYLCSHGDYPAADKLFAQALLDPFYKNPETALVNRGSCAFKSGDHALAASSLRAALQHTPNDPTALLQMAQLSFTDNDLLRARAFLERYLAASPAAADTLMLGYQIEQKVGDRLAMQTYRQRILKEFPDSAQASAMAEEPKAP
ncbi:MAG: type IV pilus biogenesis/stability protein PilW [Lysobacterales bacterium CG02_land_8_20_14_3_00_62_12]|nr:MAG: type IV pilus biogenesis/stability protein PilW [Xanthomonadales bacterium CG02_land_8_20_14_3_00_62_12]PJA41366.1 MAG: type IV pilus biogenesis/stability protein PilW [Xanthomonadales bacterium CG_4_9_14_3_um_filter_62_6]